MADLSSPPSSSSRQRPSFGPRRNAAGGRDSARICSTTTPPPASASSSAITACCRSKLTIRIPGASLSMGRSSGHPSHGRRSQSAVCHQDVADGAGMRRQRALVLRAAGRRQSLDEWRRRLRRMDRHLARRRADCRRTQTERVAHRAFRCRSGQERRRGKPSISRGMPLEKAMEPHTLLAFGMNGQALPFLHGGPLRRWFPAGPVRSARNG